MQSSPHINSLSELMAQTSQRGSLGVLLTDLQALGDPLTDQAVAERMVSIAGAALEQLNDQPTYTRGRAGIRVYLAKGLIGRLDNDAPTDGQFTWDIERAIGELQRAIAELAVDHEVNLLANAHYDLARLYEKSMLKERPALPYRLSLFHARKALDLVDKDADRELWAKIRSGYAGMLGGNPIAPLSGRDAAISMLEDTLEQIQDLAGSEVWCSTVNNLAESYIHRINGEAEVNDAKAIRLLERLAEVETEELKPGRWAQTQFALGKAWVGRDAQRSLEHFELALRGFDRVAGSVATLAEDTLYRALGAAYFAVGDTGRGHEFFAHILESVDEQGLPWARTAFIYADSVMEHDPATAERLLRGALRVFGNFESAGSSIGQASWSLARLIRQRQNEDDAELSEAIELLERAKTLLWDSLLVAAHLCRLLADEYARIGRWGEAADRYVEAIERQDLYYATLLLYKTRERVIASTVSTRHDAAYALAKAGRQADAVRMLASSKMRLLRDSLRQGESDIARLADADPELHQDFSAAAERVREAVAQDRDHDRDEQDLEALDAQSRSASRVLAEVIGRIRQLGGFEHFLEPEAPDLPPARAGTTSVFLAATRHGSMVIQVSGQPDTHLPRISTTFVEPVTAEDAWRALVVGEDATIQLTAERMQSAIREIGPSFATAICTGIPDGEVIDLVPCGPLGLLPLHLLRVSGDDIPGADGAARLLIDRYNVSYSLSGASPDRGGRRAEPTGTYTSPTALVIVNQTSDLRFAALEGSIVSGRFHGAASVQVDPTPAAVLAGIPGKALIHFVGHGSFDQAKPYSSGLRLADGVLTVASLLDADPAPLKSAELVVLSCCESAVVDPAAPDEAIGLPAAIVGSGSKCAVGTMWPVDDLATTLFMNKFYDQLEFTSGTISGDATAAALRSAQLWLRSVTARETLATTGIVNAEARSWLRLFDDDEKPYADERYWGAFVVVNR